MIAIKTTCPRHYSQFSLRCKWIYIFSNKSLALQLWQLQSSLSLQANLANGFNASSSAEILSAASKQIGGIKCEKSRFPNSPFGPTWYSPRNLFFNVFVILISPKLSPIVWTLCWFANPTFFFWSKMSLAVSALSWSLRQKFSFCAYPLFGLRYIWVWYIAAYL